MEGSKSKAARAASSTGISADSAFFVPAAAGKLMNRFADLLNVEDDLQIQIHSIANEKSGIAALPWG